MGHRRGTNALRARLPCFLCEIYVSQQTPLRSQTLDTGKKTLQPREVGFAFRRNQRVLSLLAGVMPALRDVGLVLSRLRYAQYPDARLLHQSVILAGEADCVITN